MIGKLQATARKAAVFVGLHVGLVIGPPVWAEAPLQLLNRVEALDLDISYRGATEKWCASRLDLVLTTSKPLIFFEANFLENQMSALAKRLSESCPALEKIDVTGTSRAEPDLEQLEASYVKADGWAYSSLPLPDAPPQSAGQSEQPKSAARDGSSTDQTASQPGTGDRALSAQSEQPNRELSLPEALELQKRLTFLGYPVGAVDGKPGRRTASAIRRFLSDRGQNIPARADLDVLNLVRKAAGVQSTPAAPSGEAAARTGSSEALSLKNFVDVENQSAFDTVTYLTLKALNDVPALLQRDELMLEAASRLARNKSSGLQRQTSNLVEQYKSGTSFERKDALAAMRDLFTKQISAEKNALERPLNLLIRSRVGVNQAKYVAGRGFPLSIPVNGFFRLKSNRLYQAYLFSLRSSIDLEFTAPGFGLLVPILEESKARRLAELARDRRYRFELQNYLTLGGPIEKRSERRNDLSLVARSRALRLVMIDTQQSGAAPLLVYDWRISEASQEQTTGEPTPPLGNLTPSQFAQWAGIPLIRDKYLRLSRPVTPGNEWRGGSQGWARFEDIMGFNADLELEPTADRTKRLINSFLTESERRFLTKGNKNFLASRSEYGYERPDEFEQREFELRLKRLNIEKAISRYRPALPIPVVQVVPGSMGSYNFEKRSFSIQFVEDSNRPASEVRFPLRSVSFHTLRRYPSELPLSEKDARFLVRTFFPNNRRTKPIFLGVFSQIETQPGSSRGDALIQARTERLAVYLDEQLTKKILDIPLDGLTQAEQGEFLVTAEELRRAKNVLSQETATTLQAIKSAQLLEGGEGFLKQYSRTTRAYRNASELDKPAVQQREVAQLEKEPYTQKSFWLKGRVELGRFDPATQQFRIRSIRIEKDDENDLAGNLLLSFTNPKDVRYLPSQNNKARTAIRYSRSNGRYRSFQARLLVSPRTAKILGDRDDGYRNFAVGLEVERLIAVFVPRENSPFLSFIVGEQTKGAFERGRNIAPGSLEAAAILDIPLVTDKQLVVSGAKMSGDGQAALKSLASSSKAFRQINEIDAPQELTRRIAVLEKEHDPGTTFWMGGKITLGKYDVAQARFAIESIRSSYLDTDNGDYDARISLDAANLIDFTSLPMAKEQARELLLKSGSNRSFELRMKTTPVSMTVDGSAYCCGPTFKILYEIEELYILSETEASKGDKQPYIIGLLKRGGPKEEPATQPNGNLNAGKQVDGEDTTAPRLTQALLFAHSAKNFGGTLSDQQIKWLAAQHWLAERAGSTGLPQSFFQPGEKIGKETRDRLMGWYKSLPKTIPNRLRLDWQMVRDLQMLREVDPQDKSLSITPVSPRARALACNFLMLGQAPPDSYAGQNVKPFYFRSYSTLQCGTREAQLLSKGVEQTDVSWLPKVSILLDDLLPTDGVQSGSNFAELEIEITSIDIEKNPAGLPNVHLRASLRKADYFQWALHKSEKTPRKKSMGSVEKKSDGEGSSRENSPPSVLGIELGSTLQSAEEKILSHMGDGVLRYSTQPEEKVDQPPFQFARVYMRPDGSEKILVYHEPDSDEPDRVLAVHRTWHTIANQQITGPAVMIAGRRKFGNPDVLNEDSGTLLIWGRGTKQANNNYADHVCVLGNNSLFPSVWKSQDGRVANVFDFPEWQQKGRQLGLSGGPGMTNYSDEGIRDFYSRCGPYLRIAFNNNEKLLDTQLVDTPAYIDAYLSARKSRAEAIENAVDPTKSIDQDIKL